MGAKEKIKYWLIGLFGSTLLRLVAFTIRIQKLGFDSEAWKNFHDSPKIFLFWHSRQLFMPWTYYEIVRTSKPRDLDMLISKHKDGRIVASVVHFLGIGNIAGSSSNGGLPAARNIIQAVRLGRHVAITPDGPRGPVCKLKPGIIKIARLAGVPICPVAIGASNPWRFNSWDGMIFPKPFSKMCVAAGEPIMVPRELSEEDFDIWCEKIERAISDITEQADFAAGLSTQ